MSIDSFSHVISLSASDNSNEKRRYICLSDSKNQSTYLFGFINAVYPEGVLHEPVEFWKCIYRSCNVRLCSRKDLYYPIRDASSDNVARHIHPPNFSNDFFSKHEFKVEKSLILVKSTGLPHSTSPYINNVRYQPYPLKRPDGSFQNGAVLKQLLTAGKEKEKKGENNESDGWKTYRTIDTSPSPPASPSLTEAEPQSVTLGKMFPIKPTFIRPVSKLTAVKWSPPVLSPPPSGVYTPAFSLVAHIEPYVEPQVMYNPFFLWQLHAYRMEEEHRSLSYTTSPTFSVELSSNSS